MRLDPIAPDSHYEKSWLHRALLGSGYRRLWATPISVPVLDLHRYAGGLRAVGQGGGLQTTSLHLETPDGREFSFRSVDKRRDHAPAAGTPQERRRPKSGRTRSARYIRLEPWWCCRCSKPQVYSVLGPHLFVMPDDPALGEFRKRFAGVAWHFGGMAYTPPFEGAGKIVTTDQLYALLTAISASGWTVVPSSPPDSMDVYLGDADRGANAVDVARPRRRRARHWVPLPNDRDYAFVRFQWTGLDIARHQVSRRWWVSATDIPVCSGRTGTPGSSIVGCWVNWTRRRGIRWRTSFRRV